MILCVCIYIYTHTLTHTQPVVGAGGGGGMKYCYRLLSNVHGPGGSIFICQALRDGGWGR